MAARKPKSQRNEPTPPPVLTMQGLHVLLALADHDQHGWAILRDIEQATDGEITLSAGTLYGLIKRLSDQGLVELSEDRPPARWDDRRRRYYRLTDLGRAAAQEKLDKLESTLALARQRHLVARET